MNQKLRLELEIDDEEEEEEMSSRKMENSETKQFVKATQPKYNNFDGINLSFTSLVFLKQSLPKHTFYFLSFRDVL